MIPDQAHGSRLSRSPGVAAVREMGRLGWVATMSVSLLLTLAGCELLVGHRVLIPPGAQVGRMVISGDTLTIDPSTWPSGDIYFAIEGSPTGLVLVKGSSEEGPGRPLTDDDIASLTRGGSSGFAFFGSMVGEDNILRLSGLPPGRYALILEADDSQPGVAPRAITILTVMP